MKKTYVQPQVILQEKIRFETKASGCSTPR